MNIEAAREEFLALMQRLEEEPHHVQHVAQLALRLFDELEDLHGLGDHDRLLLEAAACLHDIGWSVSPDGRGHHRESARLIREHSWIHFNTESVTLFAQVARYHRKSPPTLEHEDYASLSPAERLRVQHLAALLRIADGLDRSHQQHVVHLSASVLAGRVVVYLTSDRPCRREIGAALRKADLAQSLFKREFIFTSDARPPGEIPGLS